VFADEAQSFANPEIPKAGTKKGREFDPRPLSNCKAIQEQQTQHHHSIEKNK
jgi:hypothetical protein